MPDLHTLNLRVNPCNRLPEHHRMGEMSGQPFLDIGIGLVQLGVQVAQDAGFGGREVELCELGCVGN